MQVARKELMKKIILIICLFLLSGCTIDYNLEIKDSKLNESLDFEVTEQDYTNYVNAQEEKENLNLNEYFDKTEILSFRQDVTNKHKKIINNVTDGIKAKYTYEYDYSNFINSYIINNCFEKYIILNDENYYYIKLSGKFNCYYDKTAINITTDRKVYNENSNNKNNNTYTWEINDSNKDSISILFQISKKYNNNVDSNIKDKSSSSILVIILSCLLGLVIAGIFVYIKYSKMNNKVS